MLILTVALAIFAVLEVSNVVLLYFVPTSRLGNGVGVFNAYEKSKADPEVHALVRYLVNWVAGTKLIFLALILVVIFTGPPETKLWSGAVLIVSIATYFWRLHPLILNMDAEGQITPRGYSRTLGLMIAGFLVMFGSALGLSIFFPLS